jgi:hypothetical protein
MAENKVVTLDLQTNIDQAEKSVGSLKSQLREAQNEVAALSDKFGATSKEAVEAAKKAGELKDKIGDAKALTDAFNPDAKFKSLTASLSGAAGGLAAVTGAYGLLGGQSKEVEGLILKVQSAMALSSGLQAVGESVDSFKQLRAVVSSYTLVQKISTAAQWLWNAAMSANPLGAIVLVIAAVIAAGYKLISFFMESAAANETAMAATKKNTNALKEQEKSTKSNSEALKENNDKQYALAKASGASAEELRKLSLKHAEETIALNKKNTMLARSTFLREADTLAALKANGASDEVIAAQDKLVKAAYTSFDKQREGLYASYKDRRKVITDNEVAIVQERTDANKKAQDDAKKHHDDLLEKQIEADKKKAEQRAKFAKEEKERIEKENSDYWNKYKEIATNQKNTDFEDKKAFDEADAILTDGIAADKLNKLRKNAKEEEELQKNKDLAIATSKENLTSIISGLESTGLAKTKAGQVLSKTIALTQIGIDSAVALSKASTLANAEGVAAQLAFPLVPGIGTIARVISYATTAMSVASNISKAKQLLSGGGSVSAGGGSAPSAGGVPSAPAAPSFNVVGNSGVNQIAGVMQQQGAPVLKTYVTAGDVTTAQGLNRNIVSNATLG